MAPRHAQLNFQAIGMGLFIPILGWGAVVSIVTISGYPGVVCMTPVAWLLALTVGRRVHQFSNSPRSMMLKEAALSGAVFGFLLGILFTAAMAVSPLVTSSPSSDLPDPFFTATLMILVSIPVTTLLSAGMAWLIERRLTNETTLE